MSYSNFNDDLRWQWNSILLYRLKLQSCTPPGFNGCFSFAPDFSKLFGAQGSPSSDSLLNLCGDYHDPFVCP